MVLLSNQLNYVILFLLECADMTEQLPGGSLMPGESHHMLETFWESVLEDIRDMNLVGATVLTYIFM